MHAKKTSTRAFGTSKRESHDASKFYGRSLYATGVPLVVDIDGEAQKIDSDREELGGLLERQKSTAMSTRSVADAPKSEWADRIYCHTAEAMDDVPDNSVALAFTSPPYNAGKTFDDDLDLPDYFRLIRNVAREVYRTLVAGGRYVVNVANLGRKPYIPLHAYFYALHTEVGFLPAGEIIWQKAKGASGHCAWGSWKSAKSPRLRDIHEYLLVFVKDDFSRPDKGVSTIGRDEFMSSTLSVWEVPPESAKRVGHPAPFPVALASKVIQLFSYKNDVVLDPFCGSGSTCIAARQSSRWYVGYDINEEYCQLATDRLSDVVAD